MTIEPSFCFLPPPQCLSYKYLCFPNIRSSYNPRSPGDHYTRLPNRLLLPDFISARARTRNTLGRRRESRRYGRNCWLVVYLDINEYGIRQRETERAIAAITQRHAQSFGGLFVIWKDQLL
jgi:hypothetical protein